MDAQPKRRWFRFQLSTVLILTAIAAWGMACRPYVGLFYHHDIADRSYSAGHIPNDLGDEGHWVTSFMSSKATTGQHGLQLYVGPNPELAYPALALAAFLAWKAVGAVVERRRASRATQV
jgi:hypothetical protein